MLRLRVKAPFAAYRSFTAGSYRPSAPFVTPSAAYGLVLNLAAIEMRADDGVSAMTLTAAGLPGVELAIGAYSVPERHSLFQQLHNYPVGSTGKDRAAATKGNKYNIQPIRRECLSGIDACFVLRNNTDLERRVLEGLEQGARFAPEGGARYGLPFLGDNSYMLSHLDEDTDPQPCRWYVRIDGADADPGPDTARLTAWIDRADASRTVSHLYDRIEEPSVEPPEPAFTRLPPEPAAK